MLNSWASLVSLSICILFSAPVSVSATADGNSNIQETSRFVIGRISARAKKSLANLRAMNRYLKKTLPNGQNIVFDEIVVPSLSEMIILLKEGHVDLLSETPIGAIELEQAAGAEIILHEWKKGVAEYSGLIISHKDNDFKNLDDLKGHVVAFEDAGSTSGFLIPMAAFIKEDIKCVELGRRTDKPPAGTVGYVFADVELNIASLVARKIVDAGAISDLNWNDIEEVPLGFRERLNIIYKSDNVPRSTVLVRSGLPKELKRSLISVFKDMHTSEEGMYAMKKYHGVARFVPIDDKTAHQFEPVRQIHKLVKGYVK